ncbi:Peptidylprolyl isomerase [Apiospora sp. TS-2023a]
MKNLILPLSLVASAAVGAMAAELKIEVTQAVDCDRKTKKGDAVEMHYKGTLAANGNKFDASYDRNTPFKFNLGTGQVIAGWDEGLLDMCIGEKRTLTIPPEKGYGNRGMGPIPAGSTLIFETELLGIKGVPKPEPIKYKSASSTASDASSTVSSTASEAAEKATDKAEKATDSAKGGVKQAAASVVSAAADAAGTMLVDTDDVQEHNEL